MHIIGHYSNFYTIKHTHTHTGGAYDRYYSNFYTLKHTHTHTQVVRMMIGAIATFIQYYTLD